MQINTDTDQKEMKSHGNYRYPVCISYERIGAYESGSFQWHWHPEIELTLFLKGEMIYQINQDSYHVKAGQALFGNCNTLHTGRMLHPGQSLPDCEYLSITFHPRILYGNDSSILKSRYIDCICAGNTLPSLHLDGSQEWHEQAISHLLEIHRIAGEKPTAPELRTQIELSQFWLLLYLWFQDSTKELQPYSLKNQERLQHILEFIQNHYQEKISLEDIAGSVNICRSECCRFFKAQIGETLFHYLLHYRIQQSLPLLAETSLSITEISEQTGFSSPAYFSRIFHKFTGISPAAYRKKANSRE
ncbi:MAG: AraC family transcriptional regulator [Lachnospiraceae bacterium]|nr:AraC family transcriptional regulator [Lachnospiraceae bacterium]MDY4969488.1 AraC family transcriptional regulator [Lachnospiraceae bacterium]